jgi:lysophospholipase L1-like esterase
MRSALKPGWPVLLCLGLCGISNAFAESALKSGDRIAFLGDSITEQGWNQPGGYVRLVMAGLEVNGIKATAVPAGVSGNKSPQMLQRLSRDVLAKKPTWLTVSCGVNDVWHGARGVSLEAYRTNIATLLSLAQSNGVKAMVMTATPIGEVLENPNNQRLALYNDFLRSYAREQGFALADVSQACQAELRTRQATNSQGNLLTVDGVHMNFDGNRVMAASLLRAFGLEEAQVQQAIAAWNKIPGTVQRTVAFKTGGPDELPATIRVSGQQWEKLLAAAGEKGWPIENYLRELVNEEGWTFIKAKGEFNSVEDIHAQNRVAEIRQKLDARVQERIEGIAGK